VGRVTFYRQSGNHIALEHFVRDGSGYLVDKSRAHLRILGSIASAFSSIISRFAGCGWLFFYIKSWQEEVYFWRLYRPTYPLSETLRAGDSNLKQ
jgi:hypothetical protein